MNLPMGKNIELFTDSSLYGNDIIERVKQLACPKCSILIYDAKGTGPSEEMQSKAKAYGIASMPAIVMDGRIIPLEKLAKGSLANLVHHLFKK